MKTLKTNSTKESWKHLSIAGEASAIAFAIEHPGCLLIIDDYKGRKFAEKLGITITGSLGVIIQAKLSGHIPSIKPLLRKIQDSNFRLSDALKKLALDRADESEQM